MFFPSREMIMTQRRKAYKIAVLTVAVAVSVGAPVRLPAADPPSPAPRGKRVLRVAADPNNLPFSNERREGFENRIAELLAAELGADLEYAWRAQRRGFFRSAFKEGEAGLVVGVPVGFDL